MEIDGHNLTRKQFSMLSRELCTVELSKDAVEKVCESRNLVEEISKGDKPVYGINTGFGSLANVKICNKDLEMLQRNLIWSHSCAVGEPLPIDVVKGAMVLRANTLAKGNSGIRIEVLKLLTSMINCDIIPYVPMHGSVGASGDLALLSTIAGCMIPGSPDYTYRVYHFKDNQWVLRPAIEALSECGLEPIALSSKEGLALNNGCQVSASLAVLALEDGIKALRCADIAFALSAQALLANSSPFDPRVSKLRPYKGHIAQAEIFRSLLQGSMLIDSDRGKVQDAYSVRCAPQVHGAVRDAVAYAEGMLVVEMNSATDNPLIDGCPISGGNFHGAPVAQTADLLSIAFTDLASICERRTFRLISPKLSGLPAFLTNDAGLSSGLMIPQYTSASLVSHCKSLSYPGSVDSIPTCDDQEDHVSMAPISSMKLRQIVDNLLWIVSIELLTATNAVNMRLTMNSFDQVSLSKDTNIAYQMLKEYSIVDKDKPLTDTISNIRKLIVNKSLINPLSHIWNRDVVD
jgi:histidine ammonia-lyase